MELSGHFPTPHATVRTRNSISLRRSRGEHSINIKVGSAGYFLWNLFRNVFVAGNPIILSTHLFFLIHLAFVRMSQNRNSAF